jgi:hypothetical protein
VCLSWSWTPLNLVSLHFSKLLPHSDCCKLTLLLVMNLKPSVKVVIKLKTLLFSYGLQFSTLNTIVGYTIQFVDCFLDFLQLWTVTLT